MSARARVPVRIRPRFGSEKASFADAPEVAEAAPSVTDWEVAARTDWPVAPARSEPRTETTHSTQESEEEKSLEMWRDRALRLQAEMENFRRRQQRLTDERIAADRERLLRAFLNVADDLERALNADGTDVESLRKGVDLTYQSLMRILDQEGAEPIEATEQPFDPNWHEAVGTIPHEQMAAEPHTVVEVVRKGYRLEDRLLRPARVIVAA